MADVTLASLQLVHLVGINIDAQDPEPGCNKGTSQRKSDIAQTNDPHPGSAILKLGQQRGVQNLPWEALIGECSAENACFRFLVVCLLSRQGVGRAEIRMCCSRRFWRSSTSACWASSNTSSCRKSKINSLNEMAN